MVTSRIADHVGRVLGGRYRLLAPIGTGASAHVFVADDVVLRRRVAVKLLHPALAADESFLRRFRAEAQAVAALRHPNVVAVHDWGEDDDGPYMVLEFLDGGSLRDVLDAGRRLNPAQAVWVGMQAARALDYAHRRGIVHRDIKPANLLFDDEARLCIGDFGIARALAEAAWTEPSGAVVGTARYASPEQARGSILDGRSDVYSLALVLVESVTGRVPFAADTTLATLMARVDRPIEAPTELGPLAQVVTSAGTPDPADRLDAAGLARALDAAARDLDTPPPLPLVRRHDDDVTVPMHDPDPTVLPVSGEPTVFDAVAAVEPDDAVSEAGEPFAMAGRRRRKWPWVAMISLVTMAILAGVTYGVVQARIPSHPVPALQRMTVVAAQAEVRDEDFDIEIARRTYDENVGAGLIISQQPRPGASLKEGRDVKVVVSRGPSPRQVPDLAGKPEAEAVKLLQERGLPPKIERVHHEEIPKGIVADWGPRGSQPRGQEIVVRVSDGPEPREVPDVKGKSCADATKAIEAAGLKASCKEDFHDSVPAGQAIGTTPAAGQGAPRGSTVTVRISKGPDMVTVPDVVGKTVDEATAIIEAHRLTVEEVIGHPNGRVWATNPREGERVKAGTGVTLASRRS